MSLKRFDTLYTGAKIPLVGLGTWRSEPNLVGEAVKVALASGYRHLDCAWIYQNEAEVGAAIKASGVPRSEIFITSKLWNTYHHPARVEQGLNETLTNLGVDYLDLFLIHWPVGQPNDKGSLFPTDSNNYPILEEGYNLVDTWKAMEKLVESGKVKHIGISNFILPKVQNILDNATIKPAVLQIELHPYFPQPELVQFCQSNGIHVTAYSPLGSKGEPNVRDDSVLIDIAKKYNCTTAQVALAWGQSRNTSVIPKSTTPSRIEQNFQDIEIAKEDLEKVASIQTRHRFAVPSKGIFE